VLITTKSYSTYNARHSKVPEREPSWKGPEQNKTNFFTASEVRRGMGYSSINTAVIGAPIKGAATIGYHAMRHALCLPTGR
jgi:hypothetical protein